MPIPDSSIDGVVSLGVVEHLEKGLHQVLQEHLRILKPGGRLFITVPRMNSLKRWEDKRLFAGDFYPSWRGHLVSRVTDPSPSREQTEGTFYQYEFPDSFILGSLRQAGFTVDWARPACLLSGMREFGPARWAFAQRENRYRSELGSVPSPQPDSHLQREQGRGLRRLLGAERAQGPLERWILGRLLRHAGHILMVVAEKQPPQQGLHA
jgi:SAM-dependent methyltransferase